MVSLADSQIAGSWNQGIDNNSRSHLDILNILASNKIDFINLNSLCALLGAAPSSLVVLWNHPGLCLVFILSALTQVIDPWYLIMKWNVWH